METINLNPLFMVEFKSFLNPHYSKAKKGKAWIRKVYKKMKFSACPSCGKVMINKKSNQKCDECKERERIQSRIRICASCGNPFMLEDHQHGGERICPKCKEGDYFFVWDRLGPFIDHPHKYWPEISDMSKRIHRFASKARNDVQSTTDYPEFKMRHISFESMKQDTPTMDHLNGMTYILKNYLTKVFEGSMKYDFEEFKKYYKKYAVQFPVTQRHNLDLRPFQENGVKPDEYVNVVGNLEGHTKEETVEIIKEHFING